MREQKEILLKNGNYPIKSFDEKTEKEITVDNFVDFKRDEGKYFRLTEMSAMQRERWSVKSLSLLKQDINENIEAAAEISKNHSATAAFYSILEKNPENFAQYVEHCNEFLYCYEILDKNRGGELGQYVKLTPDNIDNYLEEGITIKFLRNFAIDFHAHFFSQGSGLISPKQTGQPLPTEQ